MSKTGADAESEAGSICDEERVRKLFQACDGDGDGFIDRFVSFDIIIMHLLCSRRRWISKNKYINKTTSTIYCISIYYPYCTIRDTNSMLSRVSLSVVLKYDVYAAPRLITQWCCVAAVYLCTCWSHACVALCLVSSYRDQCFCMAPRV